MSLIVTILLTLVVVGCNPASSSNNEKTFKFIGRAGDTQVFADTVELDEGTYRVFIMDGYKSGGIAIEKIK